MIIPCPFFNQGYTSATVNAVSQERRDQFNPDVVATCKKNEPIIGRRKYYNLGLAFTTNAVQYVH